MSRPRPLFPHALALLAIGGLATTPLAHAQLASKLDPLALFDAADTNHDSKVTREEYLAARAAKFDELDRKHAGFITEADFPRLAKAGERGERVKRMLQAADTDHDGKVSREEFKQAGMKWFDLADINHDGVVDKNELQQAADRFKQLRDKE